jgi:hypothetical protein
MEYNQMGKIEEIINWIENNSTEVIDNIEHESVDVYNFLKNEFAKSNVNENYLFQFVFRSFYRVDNAGLTPEFKKEYFNILEQYRNEKELEFEKPLKRLSEFRNRKGQKTVQFSFVTKMFNTIDDSFPIYDSKVARMFSLRRPSNGDFDCKLKKYSGQFNEIESVYRQVIKENLLPKTVQIFDQNFK